MIPGTRRKNIDFGKIVFTKYFSRICCRTVRRARIRSDENENKMSRIGFSSASNQPAVLKVWKLLHVVYRKTNKWFRALRVPVSIKSICHKLFFKEKIFFGRLWPLVEESRGHFWNQPFWENHLPLEDGFWDKSFLGRRPKKNFWNTDWNY